MEKKPLVSMPGNWPHFVVAALCINEDFTKTLLVHRSPNVRSAKDCWALPSGLLDIGETVNEALTRELKEELGLEAVKVFDRGCTVYENIAHVDGFHWVIVIKTVVVSNIEQASTPPEELDKCDGLEIMNPDELFDQVSQSLDLIRENVEPTGRLRFGPNLAQALFEHLNEMLGDRE